MQQTQRESPVSPTRTDDLIRFCPACRAQLGRLHDSGFFRCSSCGHEFAISVRAELAPRPFRATAPAALNAIGLFLNILGVLVIFVWGPPQPSLQLGVGLGLEDNTPIDAKGTTVADHDREVLRTRARYHFMSRAGLVL